MHLIALLLWLVAQPGLATRLLPADRAEVLAAQALAGVQITAPSAQYQFGSQVTFTASFKAPQAPQAAYLYVSLRDGVVRVYPISLGPGNSLVTVLDLKQETLSPFSRVYYWYRLNFSGGATYTSPSFWFDYDDNRFTWQSLSSNVFHIHWIEGDAVFGQSLLDVAQAGFKANQGILPVPPPAKPINIYVYAHARDLQSALELSGLNWVEGHASPDLGIILVSIPQGPDQRIAMEQQIPHELSHVMLYLWIGSAYSRVPTWLTEGLASMMELYPNSDYPHAIEIASQKGTLLPLSSLCQSFPKDASNSFLAYAESESFVRYLNTTYGVSGIQALVQRSVDGMGCSEATDAALGTPLDVLDARWRKESLGLNVTSVALGNLAPYFLVAALALIPLAVLGFRSKRPRKAGEIHGG